MATLIIDGFEQREHRPYPATNGLLVRTFDDHRGRVDSDNANLFLGEQLSNGRSLLANALPFDPLVGNQ
jgi:hypothetical protein